jgi:4-hydroxybenzoate polyprenyltransferase
LSFFKTVAGFFIYSSIWIGACAAAQAFYSSDLLELPGHPNLYYLICVFSGTVAIYSAHHLMGLRSPRTQASIPREFVTRNKALITGIGILAGIVAGYTFFNLPQPEYSLLLIIPALISLAYVFPVPGSGQRIRDIGGVKIILVALVWSWIVAGVPVVSSTEFSWGIFGFAFGERLLFLLAATIPFEIRDLHTDKQQDIGSLPAMVGVRNSKLLALLCLNLSACLNILAIVLGYFPVNLTVPYGLFFILCLTLIAFADQRRHEYFFSGMVDGSMIVLPLLYYFSH